NSKVLKQIDDNVIGLLKLIESKSILIPGGYNNDDQGSHLIGIYIQKYKDSYGVTIINTGAGIQYQKLLPSNIYNTDIFRTYGIITFRVNIEKLRLFLKV